MVDALILKIRRRETPFYSTLYDLAKRARKFEVPVVRPLYRLLAWERLLRRGLWSSCTRILYHTPIFKLRCASAGSGLYLIGGIPLVMGPLRLILGDDVSIHGKSTLIGAKVFDNPTLTVGSNSCLGYQLIIDVGRDVTIGKNVFIGDRVSILSYDGHPTKPEERHLPASRASSKPIVIGDNVWISGNCVILKGVTIGENSVIANGSVVSAKVPPNSLAFGNPARCFPLGSMGT
ncbi:MAG: DapH/DapD/GlmU-related protein [Geobacteraceae bacterium]|nr:DapH/DapD/GlmU-related protein [Geobacteraceae bacterium]